jgi:hypothetical protein
MFKLFIAAGFLCCLLSCNAQSSKKKTGTQTSKDKNSDMQEGKDYVILKRFRTVDQQAFNQTVEASSFLLPANWQVNTGVQWNATNKCIAEIVQAYVKAESPDKEYELFLLPVTQFDWSDDPVYLDAMQRGFNMHSCTIARPLDAAGYIAQGLAPYMQAQVKSAAIIPDLQQAMDQAAAQMTNLARQAGNNAYSHQGSAAEGLLRFNDGKEGIALCTVMQTIVTLPGTQGGMASTWQSYVSMRMVMKYKPGNEAMARKILSTFLGSVRINPQWGTGVQGILAAIGRNAQIQIGVQIEIAHQAQQEISNNIVRNWESRNATSSDPSNNTGAFSQYLRGVDSWTDDGGNKVELTSGYTNAWSKGDGSYLMSNNPAFNPNVELGGTQSWTAMKQ